MVDCSSSTVGIVVILSPPTTIGSVGSEEGGVLAELSASIPLVVAGSLPLVCAIVEYMSFTVGFDEELAITEESCGVFGLAEGGDAGSCESSVSTGDKLLAMSSLAVEPVSSSVLFVVDVVVAFSVVLRSLPVPSGDVVDQVSWPFSGDDWSMRVTVVKS